MKKVFLYVMALTAVLLVSCTGSRGPEGPPGIDGEDGVNVVGQTFEYDQVNFDYDPDSNMWITGVDVPDDIEVLESDAILVFRVEGDPDNEVYSMIPQNFFIGDKTIQYVYDHTPFDVQIYIDGNFDLSNLNPDFTDNQIFRFVVVPSDFANDPEVDIRQFSDLMKYGVEFKNRSL